MNPLTHTKVNLYLLDKYGIKENRDLILIGGILPDIAQVGVIPFKDAHERSIEFIDYLRQKDPKMIGLGFGFMLHGENPHGLDFYAHRKGGFIEANEMAVYNIVHKHKPSLSPKDMNLFIHTLIEFAADGLADEACAVALNKALKGQDISKIQFHLYNFFGGDATKIKRVLQFAKRIDARKLLNANKIGAYWKNYMAIQNLSEGNHIKTYFFLTKLITFTRKSTLVKMIEEAKDLLREPYAQFIEEAQQEMAKSFFEPFDRKILQDQLSGKVSIHL